jgi:hypothetical protein
MKARFWLGSGVILNVHLAQNALELVDLRLDVGAEVLRIVADRDITQVDEPLVDHRHVERIERRAANRGDGLDGRPRGYGEPIPVSRLVARVPSSATVGYSAGPDDGEHLRLRQQCGAVLTLMS